MSKSKYRKGERIMSIDELRRQDRIYFFDKVTNRSWFNNWQFGWTIAHLEMGHFYYAIKEDGDANDGQEESDSGDRGDLRDGQSRISLQLQ